MKTWMKPELEELEIKATANGLQPSEDFDSEWVQIDGKWYLPGNGGTSR